MKGFTFYLTYWDVANELDPEDQGQFYRAVADYMFADVDREKELSLSAKIAFKCIKANLKRSKEQSDKSAKRCGSQSNCEPNANQTQSKCEPNDNQTQSKCEPNANQTQSKCEPNANQTTARLISSSSSSSRLSSSASASAKQATAKRGKPPACPRCGRRLSRNTQTAKWECDSCTEVFEVIS